MKSLKHICFTFLFIACQEKTPKPIDLPPAKVEFNFFYALMNQNPTLMEDLAGEFKGDSVILTTFAGTDVSKIKPSFQQLAEVNVDGKLQTSGVSVQDFSKPVRYDVKIAGVTKSYIVKIQDTGLPVLTISTNGRAIQSTTNYVSGTVKIHTSKGEALSSTMEIRGRGNSTWGMAKKPYKFKLPKKASLLGMNEDADWILLANYADKTLIRNDLAFELSRRVGLAYTPNSRFVDVILNGIYIGNYSLVEPIEVDKQKVNLKKEDKTDLSGGYLFEVDGFASREAINFRTTRGMPISVHYPEDENATNERVTYIKNHIDKFENALFQRPFEDQQEGFERYFDLDSYVNFYIANEVIGNPDMFWSTYMYKHQKDDKLYTGPVWDFDIAANNDNRLGSVEQRLMYDVAFEPKIWIRQLMKAPQFRQKVRKRWNELYPSQLNMAPMIDKLINQLKYSQKKNFDKWPILSQKVYNNLQAAGTYEAEIAILSGYFQNRILWLNGQFNGQRFD